MLSGCNRHSYLMPKELVSCNARILIFIILWTFFIVYNVVTQIGKGTYFILNDGAYVGVAAACSESLLFPCQIEVVGRFIPLGIWMPQQKRVKVASLRDTSH